jgi:hypothetical protein
MRQQLDIALRYLSEIIGGFFAGAAFAMSLVVGVALFVGHVLMKPAITGSDLERILDYVAGPAALLFSLVGIALGIVRVRRQRMPANAAAYPTDHAAAAGQAIGGFALAIVLTIAVGAVAWPWLIISMTDRGLDSGALMGATAIPAAVGLIVFIAWRALRARKPPATTATGPRAAIRSTPPALIAVAVGSSVLLAAGTLAAVSDWHQFFFVLFGLPLALATFFAHLFSCIWFFRPLPPRG